MFVLGPGSRSQSLRIDVFYWQCATTRRSVVLFDDDQALTVLFFFCPFSSFLSKKVTLRIRRNTGRIAAHSVSVSKRFRPFRYAGLIALTG